MGGANMLHTDVDVKIAGIIAIGRLCEFKKCLLETHLSGRTHDNQPFSFISSATIIRTPAFGSLGSWTTATIDISASTFIHVETALPLVVIREPSGHSSRF